MPADDFMDAARNPAAISARSIASNNFATADLPTCIPVAALGGFSPT